MHSYKRSITIKTNNGNNKGRDMGPRINEKIFAKNVQVISNDGQNLGVMNTNDALNVAYDKGLDLVEINSDAVPVLVKIMDYGKFKFDYNIYDSCGNTKYYSRSRKIIHLTTCNYF